MSTHQRRGFLTEHLREALDTFDDIDLLRQVILPINIIRLAFTRTEGTPWPRFGNGPVFTLNRKYLRQGEYGDFLLWGAVDSETEQFKVSRISEEFARRCTMDSTPYLSLPVSWPAAQKLWPPDEAEATPTFETHAEPGQDANGRINGRFL